MKMRLVQSIKGKILLMGGVAIAASVILGSGGITALNKNSRNNEVLKEINAINVAQSAFDQECKKGNYSFYFCISIR